MEETKPSFVARKSGELIIDNEYAAWLSKVKQDFRSSQAKAAVRVNSAMLEFYWNLGRDIERLHAEANWGTSFFENLSLDLRAEFPQQKGFSVTNLKYIKRWYLFYYERIVIRQNGSDEIRQQPADELGNDAIIEFRHQVGDDLAMPQQFSLLPWRQHIEIITKCSTIREAEYYIVQSISNNWSRAILKQNISSKAFSRKGKAITNFNALLPAEQSAAVQSILKSPYDFGFLRMKEKYSEQDLEDALVHNITRFLLELGQGFAFVGRQMELRMDDDTSFFPDLVFYHYKQKRFVVVELKIVDFIPEFAGKLNFYVNAANHLLRGDGDKPTIGLLICKKANKSIVEWSFDGIENPIGVATYELQEVVDRTFAQHAIASQSQNTDKQ